MGTRGTLILSIDCEGLWGMVDCLPGVQRLITDESLTWAYRELLELLDEEEFPATFAFVSLFACDTEFQRSEAERLAQLPTHREWLATPLQAIRTGNLSGWTRPEALAEVSEHPHHEVASHSHTHLPLLEADDPMGAALLEQEGVAEWSRRSGLQIQTYVFPRNQVVPIWLRPTSIIGYREQNGAETRVGRVLSELNIRETSQQIPPPKSNPQDQPLPIPGGHICSVRRGPRRLIPAAVTRARWRSICRDAVDNGGVAHLWLHPHNLITGTRQLELLRQLLRDTRKFRASGGLIALTQREYVQSQSRSSSVGGAA